MDFFVSKSHAADAEKKDNSGGKSAGLPEIAGQLDKINGLMDEAKQSLTEHLLNGSGGGLSVDQMKSLLQPVLERLDGMGMILAGGGSAAGVAAPAVQTPGASQAAAGGSAASAASADVNELFNQQNQALSQAFNSLDKKIEDAVNYLVKSLGSAGTGVSGANSSVPLSEPDVHIQAPHEPAPAAVSAPAAAPEYRSVPASGRGGISRDQLLHSFFGTELSARPATASTCEQLLDGFLAQDKASGGLLGMLLQFHASAVDKMPLLLKDIGEAYYRWSPKRSEDLPFERALADYLCACCEAVGIKNSIELVSIGQRFDSTCHNATARGVVVTNVRGWVVLRDNGKVYTRAMVDVQ